MSLPPLREDLSIHPAPRLADGQPGWSIQDPARNRFYRIDWQTFEILARWSLGNPDKIAARINTETTLQICAEDVISVAEFLSKNELLRPDGEHTSQLLADKLSAETPSQFLWLLRHYLFFRVPLAKPDPFLSATLPWVAPLFSRTFLRLTLAIFGISFALVYRDYERFTQTWVDMFNTQGIIAYAAAIILVKVFHELGHAYTAKRFGCQVPTMGVAFLVMWPMAYTDTNDVWTLADRGARLRVVAAGVITELIIAVWATLLWVLWPPGILRDIAFLLSTTTWIATLFINASPFMRFDGYFFLSDWLDMPNLHQRAFALARWHLRELLFGFRADPPEFFSRKLTRGLILFAWLTWVYRLVVFFGIALLVYNFFFKTLGIVLFVFEIYLFILRPVSGELLEWYRLLPVIRQQRRSYWSALSALLLTLIFALPWPTGVSAPATLQSAQIFPIYAPANAQLTTIPWSEGDRVLEGQLLFGMTSPELELRARQSEALLRQRQWALEAVSLDTGQRDEYQILEQAVGLANSVALDVAADIRRNNPRAAFTGRMRDLNPDLTIGSWVHSGEKLGNLIKNDSCEVQAYIDEADLERVHPGDTAQFYTDGATVESFRLKVVQIDADATRVLPQALLSSLTGGGIKAREASGVLVPESAVYRAQLSCEEFPKSLTDHLWRGRVVIHGEWQAPLKRYLESLYSLLIRESGIG
jgi:putative peptide zinc metalloprotease protein